MKTGIERTSSTSPVPLFHALDAMSICLAIIVSFISPIFGKACVTMSLGLEGSKSEAVFGIPTFFNSVSKQCPRKLHMRFSSELVVPETIHDLSILYFANPN